MLSNELAFQLRPAGAWGATDQGNRHGATTYEEPAAQQAEGHSLKGCSARCKRLLGCWYQVPNTIRSS
jgi:hypothetical protein